MAIDIHTVGVPALEPMADKRMAKIVDARCGMVATGAPFQSLSPQLERILKALSRHRPAIVEGEERPAIGDEWITIALLCIAL